LSRRGLSLLEVMINLSLIGVMLAVVAVLCHNVFQTRRDAEKLSRDTQVSMVLLRLGQECKTGREWLAPRPGSPSQRLEFRRLDPTADRLPATVPVPPPAGFVSDEAAHMMRVNYRVDATRRTLLRQTNGSGPELECLAGVDRLAGTFLPDGRLQVELWAGEPGLEVRRSLTVRLPW
jgi:prepilin-type N-terminal cleavage/methylation domain-containing protein